ncbi:MAG: hypothetical protein QXG10_00025 [Candidatus Hadarchaeales archaeon]
MTSGPEELFSAAVCAALLVVFACGLLAVRGSCEERVEQARAHRTALDVASRVISASISGIEPEHVLNASLGQTDGQLCITIFSMDGGVLRRLGFSGEGPPEACVKLPGVVITDGGPAPCSVSVEVWKV